MQTPYEAFMETGGEGASDTPVLGSTQTPAAGPNADGVVVRYFSGCLTDESDKLFLEHIMTQSLRCQNSLREIGDITVIGEQGSFDKEGCYHVVVKYFERVDPKATKKEF